jgi:hypothetical protein
MNVLGYPKTKGNSQEIAVYDTAGEINAGCVVCQDTTGKAVKYDAALPLLGIAGKITLSGAVDVLRRGIEVAMLLKDGQTPNGGACFIDTTGAVSTTGDIQIGVFASSESFQFYDPNTNTEKAGCFVNLDINNVNVPSEEASDPQKEDIETEQEEEDLENQDKENKPNNPNRRGR